jgi:hypothetical protein
MWTRWKLEASTLARQSEMLSFEIKNKKAGLFTD